MGFLRLQTHSLRTKQEKLTNRNLTSSAPASRFLLHSASSPRRCPRAAPQSRPFPPRGKARPMAGAAVPQRSAAQPAPGTAASGRSRSRNPARAGPRAAAPPSRAAQPGAAERRARAGWPRAPLPSAAASASVPAVNRLGKNMVLTFNCCISKLLKSPQTLLHSFFSTRSRNGERWAAFAEHPSAPPGNAPAQNLQAGFDLQAQI